MINVALFGFGRIGQMHGSNLFKHPRFNLKYVYDRDERLSKNQKECLNQGQLKIIKLPLRIRA